MCGIAGFVGNIDRREEKLNMMLEAIIHRGPDSYGTWHDKDKGVSLGHRRLSIRDLSPLGAQPMESADRRWVLSYNGEIYNAQSLLEIIENKNGKIQLKGSSDTEVLIEAIARVGIKETLENAKGMFAAAAYDREEKKLYLFRDRFGEKPLYYGVVNGCFMFVSDLISFSKIPELKFEIDREVLPFYFSHGYIPGVNSIYKEIKKIQPGSILEYDIDNRIIKIEEFWSLKKCAVDGQANLFKGSFEEAGEELERLLVDSLKSQIVSDVPVGVCLSGGIDSALMSALLQKNVNHEINTFTIGVENSALDESRDAKKIAEIIGSNHHERFVTEEQMKDIIPKLSTMYSEPFADSSQIPTYFVSKLAKKDVTVLLSGDAGDELFCGYPIYMESEKLFNQLNKIPLTARRLLGAAAKESIGRGNNTIYKAGNRIMSESPADVMYRRKYASYQQEKIIKANNSYEMGQYKEIWNMPINDAKSKMMLLSQASYLTDDILVKVDRAGMAVSLENRVPMLDKDIVEFAWTLPIEYKYRDTTKAILRNILYKYVPKEVMERPKKGFSIPVNEWLINDKPLREWAESLIYGIDKADGFYNHKYAQKLWKDFTDKGYWNQTIWYILMFEDWKNR